MSFEDKFIETHWIEKEEWNELQAMLSDHDATSFILNGTTYNKREVKSVVTEGKGFQFFSSADFKNSITKELVW
ncbi:hypothetical protein [Jeotgalibaca caeni]|uniref:hypothetical protein n=1 Tax=Jeotgalibaca caeni TaxID=3028623 RepID=UPI00237DB1A2|nr:hypothetical protein [Jeotgalibaca caeni]MDE1549080.1 hypothetical protein [Jeotgalibaca caeni]